MPLIFKLQEFLVENQDCGLLGFEAKLQKREILLTEVMKLFSSRPWKHLSIIVDSDILVTSETLKPCLFSGSPSQQEVPLQRQ